MSSIRRERRDALPLTWELPAAATLAWMAVAATLLPAGRGAATWLAGAGWAWPKAGTGLTASLAGFAVYGPNVLDGGADFDTCETNGGTATCDLVL